MAQSLEQFLQDVRRATDDFEAQWRAKSATAREQYPMMLPAENSGLWLEFFSDFLRDGQI